MVYLLRFKFLGWKLRLDWTRKSISLHLMWDNRSDNCITCFGLPIRRKWSIRKTWVSNGTANYLRSKCRNSTICYLGCYKVIWCRFLRCLPDYELRSMPMWLKQERWLNHKYKKENYFFSSKEVSFFVQLCKVKFTNKILKHNILILIGLK